MTACRGAGLAARCPECGALLRELLARTSSHLEERLQPRGGCSAPSARRDSSGGSRLAKPEGFNKQCQRVRGFP